VTEALFTLKLCDRFSCLPSQLEKESVELLRMIEMERLVYGDVE
jgi:hypothetical protein